MTRRTPLFIKVSAGFAAIVPVLALVILIDQWFGGLYSARLASLNPRLFGEPTVRILSVESVQRPWGESALVTVRVENPTWRRMECWVLGGLLQPPFYYSYRDHSNHLVISDRACGLSDPVALPRFGFIDIQVLCPLDSAGWTASAIVTEADYREIRIKSEPFESSYDPDPRRVAVR